MSRYEAHSYTHSSYWYVLDTQRGHPIASPIIEAEASIIAFALNAVAEGKDLRWYEVRRAEAYAGPTDGVAP